MSSRAAGGAVRFDVTALSFNQWRGFSLRQSVLPKTQTYLRLTASPLTFIIFISWTTYFLSFVWHTWTHYCQFSSQVSRSFKTLTLDCFLVFASHKLSALQTVKFGSKSLVCVYLSLWLCCVFFQQTPGWVKTAKCWTWRIKSVVMKWTWACVTLPRFQSESW